MDGRARLAALAVAALAAAAMKLLDRGTLLRTLAAVPATLVSTPRAAHAMAPGFKRANPIQFIAGQETLVPRPAKVRKSGACGPSIRVRAA